MANETKDKAPVGEPSVITLLFPYVPPGNWESIVAYLRGRYSLYLRVSDQQQTATVYAKDAEALQVFKEDFDNLKSFIKSRNAIGFAVVHTPALSISEVTL